MSAPSVATSARPSGAPAAAPLSDSAQRVLGAALELFQQHGYDGTSLQQIADRLGVTKAAVYYHFRTKNEILAALVGPPLRDLEQLLDELETAPRSRDRREVGLRGYVDHLLRHRQVTAFLSRDIAALGQAEVWQPAQTVTARVEALLAGGDVSDDALSRLWGSATLRGIVGAMLSAPDAPDDWLREQLTEIGRHMVAGYRRAARRAAAPG